MARHTIKQGDCLISLGERYGMYWPTIWDAPDNAGLKDLRKDPSALHPGDVVVVPEPRAKELDGAAEQRHRFRRKGIPAKMRLCIKVGDTPLARRPWRMNLGGQWLEGKTDGEGFVELAIPPDVSTADLKVDDEDGSTLHFPLSFGHVAPIDTDRGLLDRLHDLGYDTHDGLAGPLQAFQADRGLEPTGSADDATRAKLKEEFGQ